MSVFYVFQGQTYKYEKLGGYVWSPKLTKDGRKNKGYETMTHIHKGDFILHNSNGLVVAISRALSDCYSGNEPNELKTAPERVIEWDNDGYRIDLEYHEFADPLKITDYKDELAAASTPDSAFDANGIGKTQYMCHLNEQHKNLILNELLKNEDNRAAVIAAL